MTTTGSNQTGHCPSRRRHSGGDRALAGVGTAVALFLTPAVNDLLLGVYLVVKGFKPSPILFDDARDAGVKISHASAAAR